MSAAYGNMVESIMRATDEPFLLFHRPPAAEKSENRQKQYSSGKQSAGPSYSTATQDAFFFKKRRDPINWRLLSSINIDRLIREADVTTLQQLLDNITFCDIEAEDLQNIDPNYVKLFQLAQLTIEYLLYSQDRLTGNRRQLQDALVSEGERESQLAKQVQTLELQLAQFAKENRQLKKTVYAYQLWSKVPGGLTNQQPVVSAYHRCRYCPKVFNSEFYLDGHLQRRHPDKPNYLADFPLIPPAQFIANTGETDNVLLINKITETIERFSNRLIETERNIRSEMEAKLQAQSTARSRDTGAEERQQERLNYQRELQDLKTMMARQLEEEKALLREERKALEALRMAQMRPISNLGRLEDDNDMDEKGMFRKLEDRYESAFSNLQSMVQKELNNLKSSLYDKEAAAKRANQLEETLLYQQSILKTPQSPKKQKSVKHDLWPEYLNMMHLFKFQPFKNFPLKSAYMHTTSQLMSQRKEVEHKANLEIERRGVRLEAVQSPQQSHRLANSLKEETAALAARNPYHMRMRAYVQDTLDSIVQNTFRLKPLNPMFRIKTAETIPLADKDDFFNDGIMALSFNPRSPTISRHMTSNHSINNDVQWDADNHSDDASDDEDQRQTTHDFTETSPVSVEPSPVSRISTPKAVESPVKSRQDTFSKAFSLFKSSKSSSKSSSGQAPLELDPALQQAVGHVPDTKSKKQPLESRKYSVEQQQQPETTEEYDVSDISDSIDSLEVPIPQEIKLGSLERLSTAKKPPQSLTNEPGDRSMTTPDISEVLREVKLSGGNLEDPKKPANLPNGAPGRKSSWTDDLDDELNKF